MDQPQPTQISSSSSGIPIDQQLATINKEIYERNVELAIRNRTLSVLRKMYEIMNSSLGVEETAEKLANAIVDQLKFKKAFIALIDKKENNIHTVGVSASEPHEQEFLESVKSPFKMLTLPLTQKDNFCISAIEERRWRMTNVLADILAPSTDPQIAEKVQGTLGILTSIIFPLIFGNEVLGVLVLGMDKHVGDLSRAERETLKELIDVVGIAVERAQLYADLKIANEQLKEMDKLKDEFVSVTSHELRTPMTAIKSYVWMVLNGKAGLLDPKAADYLNKVYISTERLINLVNDMLDVSRIESGRIQLQLAPLDIVELARQVKEEFMAKAVERNLALEITSSLSVEKASADKEKIHQVLENLVGNAFKFTPSGGYIGIDVKEVGEQIVITVSDTGKGINSADLPKLFTKFGRLGNSLVSMAESGGTGLGLYICKQIIELHKGSISAESVVGSGSKFIFTLPKA